MVACASNIHSDAMKGSHFRSGNIMFGMVGGGAADDIPGLR